MSAIPLATVETAEEPPVNLWRDAWQRLKRNKLAIFGLVVIVILAFTAIFGPSLTPYDYLSQDLASRNAPPSLAHFFGTDDLGRDVFSRIVFGTRTAFLVAVIVTFIAVLIGLLLGGVLGIGTVLYAVAIGPLSQALLPPFLVEAGGSEPCELGTTCT